MQTKQEVDEVCVRILFVMLSKQAAVQRCSINSVGVNAVGICIGAQRKNSKQENSKHKKCGNSGLAKLFQFHHAIQFFPLSPKINTNTSTNNALSVWHRLSLRVAGKRSAVAHGSNIEAIN